jgi:methionyl-tRNA synthetase
MVTQYRSGVIPAAEPDPAISAHAAEVIAQYKEAFDSLQFSKGLEALWSLLSSVDKLIVERAPWKLIKSAEPSDQEKLNQTLYTAAEAVRGAAALLAPVLPESSVKIWTQLGMTEPLSAVRIDDLAWGQLPGGQKIGETGPVFPRIDVKAAVDKMAELEEKEKLRQDTLIGKVAEVPAGPAPAPIAPPIVIDDFAKVDLRVGLVKSAVNVKGSDKLLHLSVDIGEAQPRSIVAGIAEAYKPEQVLGRKVVIVANLAPRKLRGIESQGMIVAASLEGDKPVLAAFLEDVPVGARLK